MFYSLIGANGLLLDRTAPLTLSVLAPPIVVIPPYTRLLEAQPFTSGPFVVTIELFLAWYYWDRFTPLWSGGADRPDSLHIEGTR